MDLLVWICDPGVKGGQTVMMPRLLPTALPNINPTFKELHFPKRKSYFIREGPSPQSQNTEANKTPWGFGIAVEIDGL